MLPRAVFNCDEGGAEDEVTLADDCRRFAELTFLPRNAVNAGGEICRPPLLDTPSRCRSFSPRADWPTMPLRPRHRRTERRR